MSTGETQNFGYFPHPEETEQFVATLPRSYWEQADLLVAADDNRDALNYRALVALLKQQNSPWVRDVDGSIRLVSRNQGPAGTCVGFGTCTTCDVVAAADIAVRKEPESWMAMFAADALYAIGRHASGDLGRGDGSYGSAAAKGIREWGTVHQLVYDKIDLREYDYRRARSWAATGVPNEIRQLCGEHKFNSTIRIESIEQAWSLIGNGYAFNMCSGLGFQGNRDKEGAIAQRGGWSHSMAVTSRRTTESGRRLFLVHQSWGDNWTGGPYWQDQPLGSFWADWEAIARGIRGRDCFAYAGYQGFVQRDMHWDNWF
jgi:hypothetical protein